MNYIEWNNAIGKFYFNSTKAEKNVILFITKEDIIRIGRENGITKRDKKIYKNFIKAIRRGLLGRPCNANILDLALYAFQKWRSNPLKIDGIEVNYPLYIGYLAIFILPLTERDETTGRSDSYYPKIDRFLEKYNLPEMPRQYEDYNWNSLWEDLQNWSQEVNNTELGNFELHPFQNESWVYVGKPLSQCILPPGALKLLPQFFEQCGLVPYEDISKNYIRQIILGNGKKLLNLPNKTLSTLRNQNNEIGHSIVNLVYKNYQKWTGNTDYYDEESHSTKKGMTIAQLRLCLEGNKLKGYKPYFRLYTELDFPENLRFKYHNQYVECPQFGKGWSKHLFLDHEENLSIKDEHNKWIAKFPEKSVRILIEGRNFHLSGWVEVPNMVHSKMLVLAKTECVSSIELWGKDFPNGNFKKVIAKGIPSDFNLYEIKHPPFDHPTISTLQYKTEKRINFLNGLKTDARTWFNELLPEIELENGNGSERVYLIYDSDQTKKLYLKRRSNDQPIWQLPTDIKPYEPFYIRVDNIKLNGDNLKNTIIGSCGKTHLLKESFVPARDKFGQIVNKEDCSCYILGSDLCTNNDRPFNLKQAPYEHFFKPLTNKFIQIDAGNKVIHPSSLINYLTVKIECTVKDYFAAFESIYHDSFNTEEIENQNIPLSLLKRWSINYLDFMGILDYEYSHKKIVVNPPRFIYLPSDTGIKVLLIGGRTTDFLNKLKNTAEKEGLEFNSELQHSSLKPFLLPSTVTLSGISQDDNNNVERKLKRVADSCEIKFDCKKITQFRLADFSGNINEYKEQLFPDENFIDSGWPAWVFDPEELRFIQKKIDDIDKSCSLVEYRLTEYEFKHRLWIDGMAYDINKNWGRFLYLNSLSSNVFFSDKERELVAIPGSLPLPRLLSEALVLYSGKAPKRAKMNLNGSIKWYNIYENIPYTAAYNTCLKVGQKLQEKSFSI